MATAKNYKALGTAIERYARQNIPESSKAFGEFMYHAELLRKGHITIHRKDLASLSPKYRQIISDLTSSTN